MRDGGVVLKVYMSTNKHDQVNFKIREMIKRTGLVLVVFFAQLVDMFFILYSKRKGSQSTY